MAKYRFTKKPDGSYDISATLSSRSGLIWRGAWKKVAPEKVGAAATVLGHEVRTERVRRGLTEGNAGIPGRTG